MQKKENHWKKYEQNAEMHGVMANPKRLAIINTLNVGEMSVDEIAKKLHIKPTNLSQHLTHLRRARVVKTRREGTRVFYRLVDAKIIKACDILHDFNLKQYPSA